MAIMADFARMPTQRKVLAFVIAGAVLGALYFQFVFKPLKADIEEAEGEHDAKLAQNKKLEGDIPKYAALTAHMADLNKIINENQKALPTEAELPAFFETLNRKVNEAGVEVNNWRQLKEEPIETFVKVPVEIELTGTFLEIKKFFASLVPKKKRADAPGDQVADQERVVSIDNLTLGNPSVKNRELVLTAKFVATTYREEDKSAAPSAPGQPATVAPPPKSGAAPLPGAATPKGAKLRTEDALDKGDQRNRGAAGVDEAKTPAGSGSARLKGGL